MKNRVSAFFIVLLILLMAAGCSSGNASPPDNVPNDEAADNTQSESVPEESESDEAPGVSFKDLDGNSIALSDFLGEIVVLNFWASWCPPCRQEMPDMNELNKEFIESGAAVFISVNMTDGQRETVETARQYMEDNGFDFIVLIDDQNILAYQYNITAIPQTYILDRDGSILNYIIGATTKEAILDVVDSVS